MKKGISVLQEPEEFEFYPFLPNQRREKVDQFLNRLEERYRNFAHKRYVERKTIPQIAEEMMYSERSIFKFRKIVLICWYCQQNQRVS